MMGRETSMGVEEGRKEERDDRSCGPAFCNADGIMLQSYVLD